MRGLGLLSTALAVSACIHLPTVDEPFLTIHFEGIEFFLEGECNTEIMMTPEGSSFRLTREDGLNCHYHATGRGPFRIRDHLCTWDGSTLTCDGLDLTHLCNVMGGVVLKRNGEFVAVNPLTVVAR